MKLEEYVKQSIHEYPSQYKDVDYASSRLKVLGHIFITNGNGMSFARPKDPTQGGYLLHHEDGHAPYGEKKYTGPELDEAYFASDIKVPLYDEPRLLRVQDMGRSPEHIDELRQLIWIQEAKYPFSPYPLCEYARISKAAYKAELLQPDWLAGGIEVCKEALAYYKDPERWKEDNYYPTPSNLLRTAREMMTAMNRGEAEYAEYMEDNGYKKEQSILHRAVEVWIEFHTNTVAEFVKILGMLNVVVPPEDIPEPIDFDTLLKSVDTDLQKFNQDSELSNTQKFITGVQ